MEFFTNFTRAPRIVLEKNSGKSKTERAGYIPLKQQVEAMLRAGERLAEYRDGQYDYMSDEEDDGVTMDPTRKPGVDIVDIVDAGRQAMENLRSAKNGTVETGAVGDDEKVKSGKRKKVESEKEGRDGNEIDDGTSSEDD